MAQRRMFSMQVVGNDKFLDMPATSQLLYFHLGIYADDDGFVSPRKVLRLCQAGEDDLKVLIAKQFVIPFESGVIVIKNWKENNYIQKDRYTPTIFQDEFALLSSQRNVYKLDTQDRLGKEGRKVELNVPTEPQNAEAAMQRARESLLSKKIIH